jgi:hypothetical protein
MRTGATRDDGVMGWIEDEPLRSSATGPPSAAQSTSMSDRAGAPKQKSQKSRGRLSRAVLAMLGKGLVDCFDEVRKQEVPERFKLLLRQF